MVIEFVAAAFAVAVLVMVWFVIRQSGRQGELNERIAYELLEQLAATQEKFMSRNYAEYKALQAPRQTEKTETSGGADDDSVPVAPLTFRLPPTCLPMAMRDSDAPSNGA
jgi:hypothetical protein